VRKKEEGCNMTLSEKVAYLTGLKEGLNLQEDLPEAKLFTAILDVLNDTALTLDGMEATMAELFRKIEETEQPKKEDPQKETDVLLSKLLAATGTLPETVAQPEEAAQPTEAPAPECKAAEPVQETAPAKEAEAAEKPEVAEAPEAAKEPEAAQETEPVQEAEAAQETEPIQEAEAAQETVTAEAPEAAEEAEAAKEAEAPQEPETAETPEDPEEELFEVQCPNCGLLLYLDEPALKEGSLSCPKCQKLLEFSVETEE
jgi:DNA polymerase III gamma/tau subunit